MTEKLDKLKEILRGCGRLAVAFSSGVDSAFLLKTAHDVLGENAAAISAEAPVFPEREAREAEEFCREYGIRRIVLRPDVLSVEGFAENPRNRCYFCKKLLMGEIKKAALENGFSAVAEGSNADDALDWRPGLKALSELGIMSPLTEAGLTKSEIRGLSHEMGLKTWDKPSFACLASRFAYGERITEERLKAVGEAEDYLFSLGLKQLRVRVHGDIARIETEADGFGVIAENREAVAKKLHELGFLYVSLDLDGFRSGSMNRRTTLLR